MILAIKLIYIVLFTRVFAQDDQFKEIKISDGRIIGRKLVTSNNYRYFAFQDIPYASPPVGELRLQEPKPPVKWNGVLDTTENRKICPQFQEAYSNDPRQNEDCLVLNVYTPLDMDQENKTLPVLVWIHGGSFLSFSGCKELWGPDYFIEKQIVIVTINYRLGPLGFLSTQDGVIPENLGLKDQLLAIKWVNENIKNFGGDSSQITISGQSAGAASVGYHLLNKKSKGLFQAAIMESGSPLNCWSFQKQARKVAFELGANLNSDFNTLSSSEELLSIIKAATVEELQAATFGLTINSDNMNCHLYTSTLFGPVAETGNSEHAIVVGMNHEHLKSGDINRVPIIIGINSQESLLFGLLGPTAQCTILDSFLNETVPKNMNIKEENKLPAGENIRKIYSNTTYISNPANPVKFVSDCMFNTPIARHALLQSAYTDVYFYQFSHVGTLGRYVYYDVEGATGLAHQEELGYFWRNSTIWDLNQFPEADILIHETVVDLWSQFIKYSKPTIQDTKYLQNITWPKVTMDNFSYLDIKLNLEVKEYPKNYKVWSSIYDKYSDEELDTY